MGHLRAAVENLKVRKEWRFDREMRAQALAVKFAAVEKNLGGGARDLPDLKVGDMVQIQNQRGVDPKRWCKSGKIVEKLDFNQYLVKVDGGGRLTRRNRRFLKKIISTLADKELVENEEDNCGDVRRSTRLVERYGKSDGGDVRKMETNVMEIYRKKVEIDVYTGRWSNNLGGGDNR